MIKELFLIFVSASLINNFVLAYFLGICPLISTSGKLKSAAGMGFVVTITMFLTVIFTWPVFMLLKKYNMQYLEYVVLILVITTIVQLFDIAIRTGSSKLYKSFGVYLPILMTNCIIFGASLFMMLKQYTYAQSLIFAVGGGVGFSVILLIVTGIKEELKFADIPKCIGDFGIVLIITGCLALSFMGFSSLPAR